MQRFCGFAMRRATAAAGLITSTAKSSGRSRRGAGGRRSRPCRPAWSSGISSAAEPSLMQGRGNMARRRNLDLDGPFVLHSLEMRESAAWHALSDKARRILDRLEVEHMMHGGGENGNLICTYDDFRAVGIRRQSIPHAIRVMRSARLSRGHTPWRPHNNGHQTALTLPAHIRDGPE
jgi:hypothetical protein